MVITSKLEQSFLVRVYTQHNKKYIYLQNIRTGKTNIFQSWSAAFEHIKKHSEVEGLR